MYKILLKLLVVAILASQGLALKPDAKINGVYDLSKYR